MNDHDQSNLDFIMNSSTTVLADWWESIDSDDKLYASELLSRASLERTLQQDEVSDCTQAVDMLAQFTLN